MSRFLHPTVDGRKYSIMLVSDGDAERLYNIETRIYIPRVMRSDVIQRRSIKLTGPTAQKIKQHLRAQGLKIN
jgi:hypothetical protein